MARPTKLSQKRNCAKIGFECPLDFKLRLDVALAERQMSIREAATVALSRYLKIPLTVSPRTPVVTVSSVEEVAHA